MCRSEVKTVFWIYVTSTPPLVHCSTAAWLSSTSSLSLSYCNLSLSPGYKSLCCTAHSGHSEGSDLLPQHSGFPIHICRWSKIYISFTLSAIPSHAIQVWSLREFVRITPSVVEAFQVITHWANRGSWLSYFFIHLEKKSFRFTLAEMLPLSWGPILRVNLHSNLNYIKLAEY